MIWMLEGFVLIILKCACSLVVVTEGSGRLFLFFFFFNTLKKTFMTTAICFYCAIFLFLNQTIRLTRLENASYIKAFDITKHPPPSLSFAIHCTYTLRIKRVKLLYEVTQWTFWGFFHSTPSQPDVLLQAILFNLINHRSFYLFLFVFIFFNPHPSNYGTTSVIPG